MAFFLIIKKLKFNSTSTYLVGFLAVACDVYDGVFLCCPFSHEMSWMRS